VTAAAPATGPVLRDIHLPPQPSWWPPAPGWWLLAALLLVAVFFVVRWVRSHQRERRWRRRIYAELERIAATHAAQPDPAHLAMQVSSLLRRATLMIQPDAVALSGERWLAFLDERIGGEEFSRGAGRALLDAPYRRVADFDASGLLASARRWLEQALFPLLRGRATVRAAGRLSAARSRFASLRRTRKDDAGAAGSSDA
jgi:hypothetical protein